MAAHHMFASRFVELWFYVVRRLSRRRDTLPSVYLAYSIGPEVLALEVHELDAQDDDDALQQATPLFHEGLKRIEVWCNSRKVGDVPPMANDVSDGNAIRDSA
jgi:lipid-A-disaccharide synthase-like uncharacterized protein